MKFILAIFFVLLVLFSNPSLTIGNEATNSAMKVDHISGGIEKIKEKISLFFKFDNKAKADYYQYLTEKRLGELAFVVETNQVNLIEPVASRYATSLGTLTDFISVNKISNKKMELEGMFDKHGNIVFELQKRFEFESGWWLMLQHDINTTDIFKEKIKGL